MISTYFGKTDIGRCRKKNEDNWVACPEQGLFAVADGIGGMPAGDIASQLVVEVLPPLLEQRISNPQQLTNNQIIPLINQAICDLSNRIFQESEHRIEYAGMGSTLVMALFTESNVFIAHLGDSRAYLLKQEVLYQVTNDHNLVNHLLKNREIDQAQAKNHPGKHHLLQYIGMRVQPKPDVICLPRNSGERLLLCSDGLTEMLTKEQIKILLSQSSTPEQRCNEMINAANQKGGKDNITTVLVDID